MKSIYFLIQLTLLFGITFLFSLAVNAQNTRPGLYVEGRHLYDRCGEKVILRGVNEMSIWAAGDPEGAMYFPEIKKTGANCVRIVWLTNGALDRLDRLIQNCINNQMIPMIELHDATGDWSKFPSLLRFWLRPDVVNLIKKHEQYLLVNFGNEIGDHDVTATLFAQTYENAVKQMRQAGIHTPIVIDASGWGKELGILNQTAPTLLTKDPNHNLLFSVHLYWPKFQGADANFLKTNLQQAVNVGYPLIVGELSAYGAFNSNAPNTACENLNTIDYQTILEECHRHEIGWLAWSWGTASNTGGGEAACTKMDMATNGLFANLQNGWAKEVALTSPHSIKNTSVTPHSIRTGACSTTSTSSQHGRKQLDVFPNPVHNGILTVILPQEEPIQSIWITDLTGRIVWKNERSPDFQSQTQLDVRTLINGIYLLNVSTTQGFTVQKIVIQ